MSYRARLFVRSLEDRIAPATYIVDEATVVNDGKFGIGELSLAEAISLSNKSTPVADTITFDSTVFSSPISIGISATLSISDSLTIQSPPSKLTLDGGGQFQIFSIKNSLLSYSVEISGLEFINGSASAGSTTGAAINISIDGSASISNCRFASNQASLFGGAISFSGDQLSIMDCHFEGNKALTNNGGAIHVGQNSQATIVGSTFSGNSAVSAGRRGGAIYGFAGSVISISSSTFAQNSAGVGGAV